MKKSILFLTGGDRKTPTARLWFYQMADYLNEKGYDARVNDYGADKIDYVFINRLRPDFFLEAYRKYPNAVFGALTTSTEPRRELLQFCDFVLVHSFLMNELIQPFVGNVYLRYDYEDLSDRQPKKHGSCDRIVLGYHGNHIHYNNHVVGFLGNVLERICSERNVILKVVTNESWKAEVIEGVPTEIYEWEENSHQNHFHSFDIGICPTYSSLDELRDMFVSFRDSNRVRTLLAFGIPSVCSPLFESCWQLRHQEHALFAVSETMWYENLIKLIDKPQLRQEIGNMGFKLIEEKYSRLTAIEFVERILSENQLPRSTKKQGSIEKLIALNAAYQRSQGQAILLAKTNSMVRAAARKLGFASDR